jgi:hypothetical protein
VDAASRPFPRSWSGHAECPRLPMFNRAAIQAKGMVNGGQTGDASSKQTHSG